jgi:hypothetical protein
MRVQNLLGVLGVAAATMAFTVSLLGPWNLGVSEDAKSIKPTIRQPTFASHGCQFSLKTEKPAYQPGESPVLELTAVNPTGKPVEATVWISVLTTENPLAIARTTPMPQTPWSRPWCVSLKPGETKTTRLASDVKLAANQNVTITIGDAGRKIIAKELPIKKAANPK